MRARAALAATLLRLDRHQQAIALALGQAHEDLKRFAGPEDAWAILRRAQPDRSSIFG
jgi:hypothetical protein